MLSDQTPRVRADIEDAVLAVCRSILKRDDLVLASTLDSAGVDSHQEVLIVLELEQMFDVELDMDAFLGGHDVRAIVALIAAKRWVA